MLVLTLLTVVGSVSAQWRRGVKVGGDLTDISTKNDLIDDVGIHFHGEGGWIMQYRLGGFAFQPELLYAEKGGTLKDANQSMYLSLFAGLSSENPDIRWVSRNVVLPLGVQYGIKVGKARKTRVYLQVVPAISCLLSGSVNGEKSVYEEIDDHFEFSRFDVSLGTGGGVEFGRFQLSAKYDWGFLPLAGEVLNVVSKKNLNPFYEMRNRGMDISLGYFFK